MCIEACESLGAGFAQWIFIAAAFAFGWWQKRQAAAVKRENVQLKRIVANKELEIDALREVAKGNW